MRAYKLIIYGNVQGVFFRTSACEQARKCTVRGYVKNLPNGTVECFIEGKEKNLDMFINWARKGPPLARVSAVDIANEHERGYSNFNME